MKQVRHISEGLDSMMQERQAMRLTRARRVDELETAYREAIDRIHLLYHVAAGAPEDLQHCASGLCRDALKVLGR